MFAKIINKLFSPSKKDVRPNANNIYIELRDMLREILLPIGFVADEKDVGIGEFAKYQRGTLLVELYFDKRDWLFEFFASKDVRDPVAPPRQVSMTISPSHYTAEQKIALRSRLDNWLKTLE